MPPPPVLPPAPPAVHTGIPFGPMVNTKGSSSLSVVPPVGLNPAFTGLVTDAHRPIILAKLEEARRSNGRVLLSFSGNSEKFTDENGFNLTKWKQYVDEYRGFDFSPYIGDGTLMGNFIMDEPSDPSNWNGHVVSPAEIDEMARYSKEIWPDLPAIIRAWPDYVKGYDFQYLDAVWAQYHSRFGSIDDFIEQNVRDAKASGLALVMGLNAVAGGTDPSMKGYHNDRIAMTASQVRTWGNRILDEPYACAFFMFRFYPDYFGAFRRPVGDGRAVPASARSTEATLPEILTPQTAAPHRPGDRRPQSRRHRMSWMLPSERVSTRRISTPSGVPDGRAMELTTPAYSRAAAGRPCHDR